jgi:hypothetical protein
MNFLLKVHALKAFIPEKRIKSLLFILTFYILLVSCKNGEDNDFAQWKEIKFNTQMALREVMGPFPKSMGSAPKVVVHSVEVSSKFTRKKISYESEPGDFVPAYLQIPNNPRGKKSPALICPHQTTNWGKTEPAAVAGDSSPFELAERGYVCLVPDYPYLGENSFDPYANGYVSCSMKGIANHKTGVDLLQSLPETNPTQDWSNRSLSLRTQLSVLRYSIHELRW